MILSLILLLSLVSLIGINIQLHELIRLGKKDFSGEDAQVKAMTVNIREAKKRLPKTGE